MPIKTNIYTNPAGLRHDTGPGFPESIARLETILTLPEEEPFSSLPVIECRDTDTDILLYAHPESYIHQIEAMVPDEGYTDYFGEVVLCPDTWQAAVTAANTVCRAVDDVMTGLKPTIEYMRGEVLLSWRSVNDDKVGIVHVLC